MKRNVFTLERVLHFRREAENLRKLEFSVAKREYEQAEDRLRREEESMEKLNLEFMSRQLEGISARELRMYADFFGKKKQEILRRREEVVRLDRNVAEKKDHLIEAATDKKMMEELKNKKIKAHEKALAEKERGFLDEIALRKRGME